MEMMFSIKAKRLFSGTYRLNLIIGNTSLYSSSISIEIKSVPIILALINGLPGVLFLLNKALSSTLVSKMKKLFLIFQ